MKVGFTGTQNGMTKDQQVRLTAILKELAPFDEFHHGDCVGSDAQAVDLVNRLLSNITVVCHPPTDTKKRAYAISHVEWRPAPYLQRNREIVQQSKILIATPKSRFEELRSGTWATIRYARKLGRDIVIIYPNGEKA